MLLQGLLEVCKKHWNAMMQIAGPAAGNIILSPKAFDVDISCMTLQRSLDGRFASSKKAGRTPSHAVSSLFGWKLAEPFSFLLWRTIGVGE
jgi:hypothetical protein